MDTFEYLTTEDIDQADPALTRRMTKTLANETTLYEKHVFVAGVAFDFITSVNNTILRQFNTYRRSLGGVRVMDYAHIRTRSRKDFARLEAVNLGRAMVRKWAMLTLMGTRMALDKKISQTELRAFYMGGGKSVIFVDKLSDFQNLSSSDRRSLFERFEQFLETELNGDHMTGKDVNTPVRDMDSVKAGTNYEPGRHFKSVFRIPNSGSKALH